MNSIAIRPEVRESIVYSSQAAVEEQMGSIMSKQSQAFAATVETFIQSSVLSVADSAELNLKCRVRIEDERPWPRDELPLSNTGSCTIAPPKAKGEEIPE